MKYLHCSLVLFFVLFCNSCDDFLKDNLRIKMDKETFDKEYLAWGNQNIKNYQFTYEYFDDAGPIGPVKITIKENKPPIIENSNKYNDHIIAENIPGIYDRIESTFEFIESVKNGTYNGYKINSLTLSITYNTQYHYPEKVDFSEGYVEMIDGGGYYTLKIREFKPLN